MDVDLPHAVAGYALLSVLQKLGYRVPGKSILGWVCTVGGAFWYALYHWTTAVVRHQRAPLLSMYTYEMLWLLRPLQSLWRLATAPFRVTPDLCIVGEVRCGTTTMSGYLNKFPGCQTPFSPWTVGFSDNKESFYLVGHYFGLIHPVFYRMVFPTIFTKFWYEKVLGKPFFTFDACAQYSAAPWVPATLKATNPNLRLAYCIREPVSQNISWFDFEMQCMEYFRTLGLSTPHIAGREPFTDMKEGWKASQSDEVQDMYRESEKCAGQWFLPGKYATWPRGQTASFIQMGTYIKNADRCLEHFPREQLEFFNLSDLRTSAGLEASLHRMNQLLPASCRAPDENITTWAAAAIHANANPVKAPSSSNTDLIDEMRAYYAPHNKALEKLIGRELGWK